MNVTRRSAEESRALARVDRMFGSAADGRKKWPARLPADVVCDLQLAALRHPDPYIRRSCLAMLDHNANDVSMPVFAQAIQDEVDFVRDIALHSLACEACKQDEICFADVVPPLVRMLAEDPKPDLRIKALLALYRVAGRDDRAREAIRCAARSNSDPIVRRCAANAARGVWVAPKKRYERRQRQHAALGHGSLSPASAAEA